MAKFKVLRGVKNRLPADFHDGYLYLTVDDMKLRFDINDSERKELNAFAADKLTTNAGSVSQPVYFVDGIPTAINHTIEADVPADAVFKYDEATTSKAGLMSAADKARIDALAAATTPVATNSTVGGVKGGDASDISVDADGNVSVKDNSHSHSVENITGLADYLAGDGKPTYTAEEVGAIDATEKGANGGVATLNDNGKIPSSQLPSYVDDVIEGYYNEADGKFYEENTFTTVIAEESGKIYVDIGTNKTYRYGGAASGYVFIASSLAIGETADTAFAGDKGKTAYNHAMAKGGEFAAGLYKITTNAEGHITAATLVVKQDLIDLGLPAQDTTYNEATTDAAGLMSAEDKQKLEAFSIDPNTQKKTITVDAIEALDGPGSANHSTGTEGQVLMSDGTNTYWSDIQVSTTDEKVKQTLTISDASYPILLAANGQNVDTTGGAYFDNEVYLNPHTNTISANISGNAATASALVWEDF